MLIALAPLVSVETLIAHTACITLIIGGSTLFVVGYLKKRTIKELPIFQAAIFVAAAIGLLTAMLLG
jgi:hypothetical protein